MADDMKLWSDKSASNNLGIIINSSLKSVEKVLVIPANSPVTELFIESLPPGSKMSPSF